MKIRITLHCTHPHFGGHTMQTWDYAMSDGERAEKDFRRLRLESGTSGYAMVEINIVHIEDSAAP